VDQYRFGFSTSPAASILLAGHYELTDSATEYNPTPDDQTDVIPGVGYYPNFITSRELDSEEVEGSVTARLHRSVKVRLKYQFNRADYETRHEDLFTGTPGGTVDAGEQDAHIASIGLSWNPRPELGFDASGSFADTELTTFANGIAAVVPYAGNVWSVSAAGNWSIDELTRLNATYVWSMADYRQENFTVGLPLGVEYQWHQVRASVDRRLNPQLSLNLLYLFQLYEEPTAGGFNDYTAHGVFAGLTWRWRE
jgi:hypothetical protein